MEKKQHTCTDFKVCKIIAFKFYLKLYIVNISKFRVVIL